MFSRTRLDPKTLPTAEEMNTGRGPMMDSREEKFRLSIPQRKIHRTAAYVSSLQSLDPDAKVFLEPEDDAQYSQYDVLKHVESLFAKNSSEMIPVDYLSLFEDFLYEIHEYCAQEFAAKQEVHSTDVAPRRARKKFKGWYSDVIYINIVVSLQPKQISLHHTYTRPCAERFGFFRIMLNELVRNCRYFSAVFAVSYPLERTVMLLRRSFGDHLRISERGLIEIKPDQLTDSEIKLGVYGHLLQTADVEETKEAKGLFIQQVDDQEI